MKPVRFDGSFTPAAELVIEPTVCHVTEVEPVELSHAREQRQREDGADASGGAVFF